VSPAHFHLLTRGDGERLPLPIWGSQHQPSAATHCIAFVGLPMGLAHVLALGREEHRSLPPSISALLRCAPRNCCDLRMKHLFLTVLKKFAFQVPLSTLNKNKQNDCVTT